MIALFDSSWCSSFVRGLVFIVFFFQGVFFLTVFGWHLRNVDIHLCIFYFLFLSLYFLLLSLFLPLFYGCMEEVLVFWLFMFLFFLPEWKWNGRKGGRGVTEDLVGLDFVGGFYLFFYFLSFYVLLLYLPYLCAGHFERVSFPFLTCIVLYSFLLFFLLFNNFSSSYILLCLPASHTYA